MTTHTAPNQFAIQSGAEARGSEDIKLFPALPSFADVMGRARARIELARQNPHDALAFFVLSCVGTYFTWVSVLAILCGPSE